MEASALLRRLSHTRTQRLDILGLHTNIGSGYTRGARNYEQGYKDLFPSGPFRLELRVGLKTKMADLILTKQAVDRIDSILAEMLGRSGAHSVLLIDKAGQIISSHGSMHQQKVVLYRLVEPYQ